MIRAVLLHNPHAGRASWTGQKLDWVVKELERGGLQVEVVPTRPEPPVVPSLDLCDMELLIACGGDGTIHHALPQVVRRKVPLAILPTGTVNLLARELGLPPSLPEAVRVVLGGRRRRISLGQSDGNYFHLMAGIGLDGYVISHVRDRAKRYLGSAAFVLAALRHFWSYPLPPFQLQMDGRAPVEAVFAVISNVARYGGYLRMAPQADPFEPLLDVCAFTARNHLKYFHYLWGTLRGRHLGYSGVVYEKAREIVVRGQEPLLVQMDGEVVGRLPARFSVFPQGIEVLVP